MSKEKSIPQHVIFKQLQRHREKSRNKVEVKKPHLPIDENVCVCVFVCLCVRACVCVDGSVYLSVGNFFIEIWPWCRDQ